MRSLRPLLPALLVAIGCVSTPPPSQPAIENNDFCGQYLGMGDLERAEIHCDLAAQFAPQWADPYVNKGLIAFRRGQKAPAKELYVKALRLNPDQTFAHNNLGVIYRDEGSLGRAHDSFQKALSINPNYIEARYNLALTLKQMGKKAEARKQYKTVIAIAPNIADPYNDLGIMDFEDTAYQSAARYFAQAIELDPTFSAAHQGLGNALMEQGRYTECASAFTACIDVDTNNITCRQNLTICNRKAALSTPAESGTMTLDECVANKAPEEAAACLFVRAQDLGNQGLRVEQEKALKRCAQENPRFAQCHFALFNLFKDDRRDEAARKACSNFMKAATQEEFPEEFSSCDRFLASGTF